MSGSSGSAASARPRRRAWLAKLPASCALALSLLVAAQPALAAANAPETRSALAPSSADLERARALFEHGAQAFAQRKNVEAVYYFQRAAALVPSAGFAYNIGLAYEDMGDIGRALAAYRQYLWQEPNGERKADVETRVLALEQRLANVGLQQLSVRSEPPGATVLVDETPRGITPWTGELPPGKHRVRVLLQGHRASEAEVQLERLRAADLSLVLTPEYVGAQGEPVSELDAMRASAARQNTLAWALIGTGAAALLGGVVLEISRGASQSSADESADPAEAARARGAADGKQMASLLLLGTGGGLAVSGLLLLGIGGEARGRESAPAPLPSPAPRAAAPGARRSLPRPASSAPRWRTGSVRLVCGAPFCGASAQGEF